MANNMIDGTSLKQTLWRATLDFAGVANAMHVMQDSESQYDRYYQKALEQMDVEPSDKSAVDMSKYYNAVQFDRKALREADAYRETNFDMPGYKDVYAFVENHNVYPFEVKDAFKKGMIDENAMYDVQKLDKVVSPYIDISDAKIVPMKDMISHIQQERLFRESLTRVAFVDEGLVQMKQKDASENESKMLHKMSFAVACDTKVFGEDQPVANPYLFGRSVGDKTIHSVYLDESSYHEIMYYGNCDGLWQNSNWTGVVNMSLENIHMNPMTKSPDFSKQYSMMGYLDTPLKEFNPDAHNDFVKKSLGARPLPKSLPRDVVDYQDTIQSEL